MLWYLQLFLRNWILPGWSAKPAAHIFLRALASSSIFLVEDRKFFSSNLMYLYFSPTGQLNTIFTKSYSKPPKNWLLWFSISSFLDLLLAHNFGLRCSSSFLVEGRKFLWKSQMYLYYSSTGHVTTIFLKCHSIPLKNWLLWGGQSSRARLDWHSSRLNLNFSKTIAGITEWFGVTIKGCLGYILSKFEDLIFIGLVSRPHYVHAPSVLLDIVHNAQGICWCQFTNKCYHFQSHSFKLF